jgi:hypothetical protein
MTQTISPELSGVLAQFGEQIDHLNPPDLKILAPALQAERERIHRATDETLRQMHQQRSAAIASFTQLLLCARHDLPLVHTNYFDAVADTRRLSHE